MGGALTPFVTVLKKNVCVDSVCLVLTRGMYVTKGMGVLDNTTSRLTAMALRKYGTSCKWPQRTSLVLAGVLCNFGILVYNSRTGWVDTSFVSDSSAAL